VVSLVTVARSGIREPHPVLMPSTVTCAFPAFHLAIFTERLTAPIGGISRRVGIAMIHWGSR
jgi:hypothetical protein